MQYKALTIAGSDSGGGAGIQADLKTFSARGVYGMSVLTCVTAQNTMGVQGVYDLPPNAVTQQIDSVLSDIGAHAIKTGMLSKAEIIIAVADQLMLYRDIPLVVDPVMIAKSGDTLLDPAAVNTLIERLIPLATVVTPNLSEVKTLTNLEVKDIDSMKEAAQRIRDMGAVNVVIKGGHLDGPATDLLYNGDVFETYEVDRIDTKNTHGTGCTFASAIAAELAKGYDVDIAVGNAKAYLTDAIRHTESIGSGHGPVHHFYALYQSSEKQTVLDELGSAARRLEYQDAGLIIPEVQSNLGMALPGARMPDDVAAFPGRIVRLRRGARTIAPPEFGVSSHIAKIILTAMRHDPTRRAAMNIRYSDKILAACRDLDLSISMFDRTEEPADVKKQDGSSLEWGTEQAIRATGSVPDIIYDLGDMGKEPMVRIIGPDPGHVVEIALQIVERIRGSNSSRTPIMEG